MSESVEASASDDASIKCLVCDYCDYPVAPASALIQRRADTWSKAVYAYELDLCEKMCWCYSATNPGDHRFDVACVDAKAVLNKGVVCRGKASSLHTWFPGYSWRMCACQSCGRHLGWGFSPTVSGDEEDVASDNSDKADSDSGAGEEEEEKQDGSNRSEGASNRTGEDDDNDEEWETEEEADGEQTEGSPSSVQADAGRGGGRPGAGSRGGKRRRSARSTDQGASEESASATVAAPRAAAPEIEFIGLIVTYAAERDLTRKEFEQLMDGAAERQEEHRTYTAVKQRLLRVLQSMQNGYLANQLGQILMHLEMAPRLRAGSIQALLHEAVRALESERSQTEQGGEETQEVSAVASNEVGVGVEAQEAPAVGSGGGEDEGIPGTPITESTESGATDVSSSTASTNNSVAGVAELLSDDGSEQHS